MYKDILLPIDISDPVTGEKSLETKSYLTRSCGYTAHDNRGGEFRLSNGDEFLSSGLKGNTKFFYLSVRRF